MCVFAGLAGVPRITLTCLLLAQGLIVTKAPGIALEGDFATAWPKASRKQHRALRSALARERGCWGHDYPQGIISTTGHRPRPPFNSRISPASERSRTPSPTCHRCRPHSSRSCRSTRTTSCVSCGAARLTCCPFIPSRYQRATDNREALRDFAEAAVIHFRGIGPLMNGTVDLRLRRTVFSAVFLTYSRLWQRKRWCLRCFSDRLLKDMDVTDHQTPLSAMSNYSSR